MTFPIVNPELGREEGGRLPIESVAQGDRCAPSQSSGGPWLPAVWGCFKCKKQALITALAELEVDNMSQPDPLHRKALDIKEELKDLNVKWIIEQNK